MPLDNITVTHVLKEKSSSVYSIDSASTVEAAVAKMNQQRIGSLMIKDNAKVVGIFTERDVLVRVVSNGCDPKTTIIRDVMTSEFQSITRDASVEEAMQLMTNKRVRHLPIMNGDSLVGMISIGDVTSWLLKVNEIEAENLRKYVFSDYPG